MADLGLDTEFITWKKGLLNAVADAINNEVADAVKEKLTESVQNRVYAAYTPANYNRRGDNGGLADKNNYIHHAGIWGDTVVLFVSNNTTGNPDRSIFITNIIETGAGYNWNGIVPARPFMDEGLQDGIGHGDIENALAAALARRGYAVGGFGLARG